MWRRCCSSQTRRPGVDAAVYPCWHETRSECSCCMSTLLSEWMRPGVHAEISYAARLQPFECWKCCLPGVANHDRSPSVRRWAQNQVCTQRQRSANNIAACTLVAGGLWMVMMMLTVTTMLVGHNDDDDDDTDGSSWRDRDHDADDDDECMWYIAWTHYSGRHVVIMLARVCMPCAVVVLVWLYGSRRVSDFDFRNNSAKLSSNGHLAVCFRK